MTDEKICPIMSRPHVVVVLGTTQYATAPTGEYMCQKEKCMAWVPAPSTSTWPNGIKRSEGYCKLIERR